MIHSKRASIRTAFLMPETSTKDVDKFKEYMDYRIHDATEQVILASAWVTDADVVWRLINSPAKEKIVILNRSDVENGLKNASRKPTRYYKGKAVVWQTAIDILLQACNGKDFKVYVVGSPLKQKGNGCTGFKKSDCFMHEKFLIVDKQYLFTSTAGITTGSNSNFESYTNIENCKKYIKSYIEHAFDLINHSKCMNQHQFQTLVLQSRRANRRNYYIEACRQLVNVVKNPLPWITKRRNSIKRVMNGGGIHI